MLLLGALADFQWENSLRSVDPPWFWYSVLLAVVTAVAAALVLLERSRWPWGVGLLLGVGAASTSGLVTAVTAWTVHLRWDDGLDSGLWLLLAGHAVVLAGVATVVVRVLPGTGASLGRLEVPGWVLMALAVAGATAAVSTLAGATRPDGGVVYWAIAVWAAATAAAVPVLVAFVRPRGLRVGLLLGWAVGAGLGALRGVQFYELVGSTEAARAATWAVVAVGALVPLAVVLARVGGRRQPAAATV